MKETSQIAVCTLAIHRLKESMWFSEKGSIVQQSLRVWGIHEIIHAD
jgi:hypothetical protein